MDEKDSKPPAKARRSAERLKRGEGDIRARQRSFMKQRRGVKAACLSPRRMTLSINSRLSSTGDANGKVWMRPMLRRAKKRRASPIDLEPNPSPPS
jgi:hypothetical protein